MLVQNNNYMKVLSILGKNFRLDLPKRTDAEKEKEICNYFNPSLKVYFLCCNSELKVSTLFP